MTDSPLPPKAMQAISRYYEAIARDALPGTKTKAIQIARIPANLWVDPASLKALLKNDTSEVKCKVSVADRPVAFSLTLWPDDEDAHCNCSESAEPCSHVLAAILILKNDTGVLTAPTKPTQSGVQILYCLVEQPKPRGALVAIPAWKLERRVGPNLGHWKEAPTFRSLGAPTLTALVGGFQNGRIKLPGKLTTAQADFALDGLGETSVLADNHPSRRMILSALREVTEVGILRDGKITPLAFTPQTARPKLKILWDEKLPDHLRLTIERGQASAAFETNIGMLVLESETNTPASGQPLGASFYEGVPLLSSEAALLDRPILLTASLLCEDLPVLVHKLALTEDSIPGLMYVVSAKPSRPRVCVKRELLESGHLYVQATIRYADSASNDLVEIAPGRDGITWVGAQSMSQFVRQGGTVPIRNREEERALVADFYKKTSIQVGPAQKIPGESAALRMEQLKPFLNVAEQEPLLKARMIETTPGKFEVEFFASEAKQTLKLTDVLKQIQNGSPWIKFGQGFAKIPMKELEPLAEILKLALKHPSAYMMAQIQRAAPEVFESSEGMNKISAFLKGLDSGAHVDPGALKKTIPAPTLALLRDYQLGGIQWLHLLKQSGLAALLADDMGLGKTLQALCAVTSPCLIVVPTSVLGGWAGQIKRFRPDLKFAIYHGPKRKLPPFSQLPHILLTTYGVLRSDRALLTETQWSSTILDEGQNIKNPEAQTSWAAHRLKADFKMLLSGTPIENRLEDIYSQFQYLLPGLLPDPKSQGSEFTLETVKKRVRSFILRRTKSQVAADLPPKTEMILETELTPKDQRFYRAFLNAHQTEIQDLVRDLLDPGTGTDADDDPDLREEGAGRGGEAGGGGKGGSRKAKSYFSALEILLRLRQSAVHPMLLPQNESTLEDLRGHLSAKFEVLLESLEIAIAEGHSALVFSQWARVLDLLEPELNSRGITFLRIDGSVSATQREKRVQTFEQGGAQVMLLTLKAGGVGLTLTAADHVYILDPWWNPAAEDQASDRAHRIGQTRPVMVHRIIAKDTIEEAILELQKEKRELARALLSDDATEDGAESSAAPTRDHTSLSAQDLGRILQSALDSR